MNKYIKTALVASATLLASSCNFLDEYSQDLSRAESWEDMNEILLGEGYLAPGMVSLTNYSGYSLRSLVNDNMVFLHYLTDELEQNTKNTASSADFYNGATKYYAYYTWQQDTGVNSDGLYVGGNDGTWNSLYRRINCCNMVLAGIDDVEAVGDKAILSRERVKGEAYFLRGVYYWFLVNLYAKPYDPATASSDPGVPVKLTEYIEDKEFERGTVAAVYAQIESDLLQAEKFLTGKEKVSIYQADVTATRLFLSRMYLYMQQWDKAAQYAQQVLDVQPELQALASLSPARQPLSRESVETIFSMGDFNIAGYARYEASGEPALSVSQDLMSLYDQETDYRIGKYIKYGSTGLPEFAKVDGTVSNVYFEVSASCLLRTSEAYLTLAEASYYAKDENKAKSVLAQYLPYRMSSNNVASLSGSDIMKFIREERAREFLLEGQRWFDLRRYTVQPEKWSKPIVHNFAKFKLVGWSYQASVSTYELKEYDDAYTLDIPRAVLNFQNSLGNNPRPERNPASGEE